MTITTMPEPSWREVKAALKASICGPSETAPTSPWCQQGQPSGFKQCALASAGSLDRSRWIAPDMAMGPDISASKEQGHLGQQEGRWTSEGVAELSPFFLRGSRRCVVVVRNGGRMLLGSPSAHVQPSKPGIARQGGIYYNVSVGLIAMCWTPIAASPRLRTRIARQSPRGQMPAIKVLSVAAITAMSFAVSAHAGHVNPPARVTPPKANVPKGNTSTYKKPGTVLGDGSVNRVFKKPSHPSGPTQIPIGRLPMSFAASAHAGQVRQPNTRVNVPKTGMPNPLPPTGVRGGSSGHTRLQHGLAVVPASPSRPHLKPFVRVPSAAVVR